MKRIFLFNYLKNVLLHKWIIRENLRLCTLPSYVIQKQNGVTFNRNIRIRKYTDAFRPRNDTRNSMRTLSRGCVVLISSLQFAVVSRRPIINCTCASNIKILLKAMLQREKNRRTAGQNEQIFSRRLLLPNCCR